MKNSNGGKKWYKMKKQIGLSSYKTMANFEHLIQHKPLIYEVDTSLYIPYEYNVLKK